MKGFVVLFSLPFLSLNECIGMDPLHKEEGSKEHKVHLVGQAAGINRLPQGRVLREGDERSHLGLP